MASEKVLTEQEASSQGLERSRRGQRDQRSLGDAMSTKRNLTKYRCPQGTGD